MIDGIQDDENLWLETLFVHSDFSSNSNASEAVANIRARLESYNRLPRLRQLPDHVNADGEDIVWVLVSTRQDGSTRTEVRTETNCSGGCCSCCGCIADGVDAAQSDPGVYVVAFEVDLNLPEGEKEKQLEANARQQRAEVAAALIREAEHLETVARMRERGTPVLDRLKARKDKRHEQSKIGKD